MRRHPRSWCVWLVLTVLAAIAPCRAETASAAEEQQKLEALRARIAQVRKEIEQSQEHRQSAQDQLRATAQTLADLDRNLRATRQAWNASNQRLAGLETRKKRLTQTLQQQKGVLGEQLHDRYILSRQQALQRLLNLENPMTLSRVFKYYDYFHEVQRGLIDGTQATLNELRQVNAAAAVEQQSLNQLLSDQDRQRQELGDAQQAHQTSLALLQQEIKDKKSELEKLLADERRLQALIKSLARALTEIPMDLPQSAGFAQLKGMLEKPVAGKVLVRYGSRKMSTSPRSNGIYLAAEAGSEVRCVAAGRIVFADWLRGFGLLLIIDHGDGYMTLYGNNQSLYKVVGDWVQAGETIASAGLSGGHTPSGIYFEIRQKGAAVDPAVWLKKKG